MANAFFVVWRESLEAWLIIGILATWLNANQAGRSGRAALLGGTIAGLALAGALGWALIDIQDELSGDALEAFQIGALALAALLITQMVLWMRRHGRALKSQLHNELADATARGGALGVAVVAALAVAREGAETVIFLYGMSQGADLSALALAAAAGFLAAAGTAVLAARSLAKLNVALLLRLSSIVLLILASAMLIGAIDRLIGIGWLPAIVDPLWDSSALLDDAGFSGKLLADFAGYRARPSLTTLGIAGLYWAGVLTLWRRHR